jgi:hypothetical protein
MQRVIQAGAKPVTALSVMLELQRDWAQHDTYDAVMDIVKTHFGAYGRVIAAAGAYGRIATAALVTMPNGGDNSEIYAPSFAYPITVRDRRDRSSIRRDDCTLVLRRALHGQSPKTGDTDSPNRASCRSNRINRTWNPDSLSGGQFRVAAAPQWGPKQCLRPAPPAKLQSQTMSAFLFGRNVR